MSRLALRPGLEMSESAEAASPALLRGYSGDPAPHPAPSSIRGCVHVHARTLDLRRGIPSTEGRGVKDF